MDKGGDQMRSIHQVWLWLLVYGTLTVADHGLTTYALATGRMGFTPSGPYEVNPLACPAACCAHTMTTRAGGNMSYGRGAVSTGHALVLLTGLDSSATPVMPLRDARALCEVHVMRVWHHP